MGGDVVIRKVALATVILFAFIALAVAGVSLPRDIPGQVTAADDKIHISTDSGYGETWYYLIETDGGWLLFASLSIGNTGLSKHDSSVDVTLLSPGGKKFTRHYEYDADVLTYSGSDVKIANHALWGSGKQYGIVLSEKDGLDIKLTVSNRTAQGLKIDDGRVDFDDGKWTVYNYTSIGGDSKGVAKIDGQTVNLKGRSYMTHSWGNVLPTQVADSWYRFAGFDFDCSVALSQPNLKSRLGADAIKMLLITCNSQVVAATSNYQLKIEKTVIHSESGYAIPEKMSIIAVGEDYKLTGTMTLQSQLQTEDILQRFSWLLRQAIKAFYANPWAFRIKYDYEFILEVGTETKSLKGTGYSEHNFYDN
jgi:Svf1-like C-terminal lipocalin-like domain